MDPVVQTPREPEIEFFGKVVRLFLTAARWVLFCAGSFAVAVGVYWLVQDARTAVSNENQANASTAYPETTPQLMGFVWICAGLPLLLPVGWLFGRGRWIAAGIAALLWFGPIVCPLDHRYGFVLRFAASLIACATLLVWRTLWRLTKA